MPTTRSDASEAASKDPVGATADEHRLDDDAGHGLHHERCSAEQSARVAAAAHAIRRGADQPQRRAAGARYPSGELDRRPVVLDPAERHDDRERRRVAWRAVRQQDRDVAGRVAEDRAEVAIGPPTIEQVWRGIDEEEVDVLLSRQQDRIVSRRARRIGRDAHT